MEQHCDLYSTFVDLTKAFDRVSSDGLWKIMSKFGCPHKFIASSMRACKPEPLMMVSRQNPS